MCIIESSISVDRKENKLTVRVKKSKYLLQAVKATIVMSPSDDREQQKKVRNVIVQRGKS